VLRELVRVGTDDNSMEYWEMTTYAEIWKTLVAIDCTRHVEKKGKLSYLSWAWAWSELMEHYPQACYVIHDEIESPDGTVECRVTVKIDDCERMMWLPVMDNFNKAIPSPDKRKVSDARMRCMVKCLAMFGLGHYIYAGEDVPEAVAAELAKPITEQQVQQLTHLITETESDLVRFCGVMGVSSLESMTVEKFPKALSALKDKRAKVTA
jgi:hypothetical protein